MNSLNFKKKPHIQNHLSTMPSRTTISSILIIFNGLCMVNNLPVQGQYRYPGDDNNQQLPYSGQHQPQAYHTPLSSTSERALNQNYPMTSLDRRASSSSNGQFPVAWSNQQQQTNQAPSFQLMARNMMPYINNMNNNHMMINDPASMMNNNQKLLFTTASQGPLPKAVRHINGNPQSQQQQQYHHSSMGSTRSIMLSNATAAAISASINQPQADYCHDKLCYGLPTGCLEVAAKSDSSPLEFACTVLVTSKRMIDPSNPVKRDILFELYAKTDSTTDSYAAVGFSETGRMQGLVSACIHSDKKGDRFNIITLQHSYNILGAYTNVPVNIKSGIKNLGVTVEDGTFQCRWIVQSSVEFSYELPNGTLMTTQADLGYKNFHIQLAQGSYDSAMDLKLPHSQRSSSKTAISLAQTGTIKAFGSHILLKIHGSIMIVVWIGLVTISIMLARYYKNEWVNNKLSDLALWFVLHRFMMLAAWFSSIMAVIFAYMYTETYHPGYHSISGTICITLSTVQVLGGILRPSLDSSKRVYFNWAHFVCGNLSYLLAIFCLVTASFLPSIQLPPVYIWVVALFVAFYALIHLIMTIHQFVIHKSSKISITPMGDLNSQTSHYADACGFVADTYHKESNGIKQCMIGVLVTIVVIFIIVLVTLVNFN